MRDTSFRDAVAGMFRARPHDWIDGMEIARQAGCYGWRTRISECRTQLGMVIENRVRTVNEDGRRVSEYRFLPANLLEIAS